tara:strand:+ start:54 stop:845 length:792 start_codon:yes stop_codon:yes gene_type:complete
MEYTTLLISSLSLYAVTAFILFFTKVKNKKLASFTLISALIAHASLIYVTTIINNINLNFANSLLLLSWVTVLFYYLINRKMQFIGLENLTITPAILIILCHPLLRNDQHLEIQMSIISIIHIIIAILSYSLLTIGALFSIFILLFEKKLTSIDKNIDNLTSNFSLLKMEDILFKIYWLGFVLLSITLLSGLLFSGEIFGSSLVWNHKTFFSLLAWIIYGGMLIGRFNYGWRGEKAVIISLIAFVFLFLSYFGTKFVLEILLS